MAADYKVCIKWTEKKKKTFLEVLREVGIIRRACEAVGVSRSGYYQYVGKHPEFHAEVKVAMEEAIELLEEQAMKRARDGWEEPVWYQGIQVGTVRKYSDPLAMFMLKGGKPEKYRDRHDHVHTGIPEQKVIYLPSNGREKIEE